MSGDTLLRTAEQAASGEALDWSTVRHDLAEEHHALAGELAIIARIARECRRLDLESGPGAEDAPLRKVGDRWGLLELREVVGRGAYGTVFRAWDPTLQREVALKLFRRNFDPDRVIDEGRKLAKVDYPNVVSVFGADVDGVAGIWMEFVRGRPLDRVVGDHGPFSAREAALIGLELSGAIAAVHAAGLVHRDIKAQNVMREEGGRLVLMDLGASLAVLGPDARPGQADVIGTPAYMAPELFDRQAPSRETDIYSLGVLLFYLVTIQYPVAGRTLKELRDAHQSGAMRSLRHLRPDLPSAYVALVGKLIAREPARRLTTSDELESALATLAVPGRRSRRRRRRVWPLVAASVLVAACAAGAWFWRPWRAVPPAPAVRSVGVLAIRNLTGDPKLDYIAEGLTEVLISNLSAIRSLRVPSYASVSALGASARSPSDSARQLHADFLLSGSVTVIDDRIRLVVQLLDPSKEPAAWSGTFTRDRRDVLATQAEIARVVAAQLSVRLSPAEERALAQRPVSAEAQDAYLRGLAEHNSQADDRQATATAYFQRAIDLEPAFASAWAERAIVDLRLAEDSPLEKRGAFVALSREAALRAIELDPSGGLGYAALGALQFYYEWDFPAAEVSFRRAIDLNPSSAFAHERYSMFLAALRRMPEALAEGKAARDLEPLVANRAVAYAFLFYYAHDFSRAADEMRHALLIDPGSTLAHFGLGRILAAMNAPDDAVREITLALTGSRNAAWLLELARVYAVAHRPADAAAVLAEVGQLPSGRQLGVGYGTAYLAAADGRLDEAFRDLDGEVNRRVVSLLWMAVDPRADPLRGDPRFSQLLRRMGL